MTWIGNYILLNANSHISNVKRHLSRWGDLTVLSDMCMEGTYGVVKKKRKKVKPLEASKCPL